MQGDPAQPRRPVPVPAQGPARHAIRPARPDDGEAVARVFVECMRSGYHGIIPAAYAERLSIDDQGELWSRLLATPGNAALVAETSQGDLAGFVCGGPERSGDRQYFAEIYGLFVLPEARGQQLGRCLFEGFCAQLMRVGLRSLIARALEADPRGAFYEALGGLEIDVRPVQVAGRSLNEVAYGWRDVRRALRQRSAGDKA